MIKANKDAARAWQAEQAAQSRQVEDLKEQTHLLWYAGCKRKSGFPCPDTLRSLGRADVAEKVEQAYALLAEAHRLISADVSESHVQRV